MRSYLPALIALTVALRTAFALTIVSPFPGSTVDPTKPITLVWTVGSTDPSTFDLHYDNPTNSLYKDTTIASGIQTNSESYTIPADSLLAYGTGFELKVVSNGNTLATVGSLILNQETSVQTSSQNDESPSTTSSDVAASTSSDVLPSSSAAVIPATVSSAASALTMPTTTIYVTPISTSTTSTGASTGFITITGTSTTQASSRSSTATTSATASAASKGAAPSLQARLNSWEMLFTAAGVLAGIVALFT